MVLNGGNGKDVNEGGEQAMVVERPLERESLPGLKKLNIPPLTADFTLEKHSGDPGTLSQFGQSLDVDGVGL